MSDINNYVDDSWYMNESIEKYIERKRSEYYREWEEYCDEYEIEYDQTEEIRFDY